MRKISTNKSIEEDFSKHYRIIDFVLVFTALTTLVMCGVCAGNVSFQSYKKEGLGFKIKVTCKNCKNPRYVSSSERIESGGYEINRRFIFAMRVLGLGLADCEKFCGLMDSASSFLTKSKYNTYINKICESVKKVASTLLAFAVKEEKQAS